MCFAPVVGKAYNFVFNEVHRGYRRFEFPDHDLNAATVWEGTDSGIGHRRVRGVVHSE